ncbi:vWA domain-containing protein [Desulforamulus hydrothermalis]|uniref:von Willebrand factor type A n=1 Tax=Desulforamulus hydrothermalis Lam5 = DSM 18033 TaxID=1121428 RepID=K8DY76_9FIRM|nr:VWA domain-containing protein [Desulforamulus hydrothermalis]CCO07645.1 von Willebrand factor type A [Desulforamulus hydrothermalis Lam5 = DSM 18033]SHH24431.1 Ca-activated chloride channel family protein [Desulforamulus hydrothermalis Lam5 = DSM 18033]
MEQIKVDLALDKTFLLPGNKQAAYLMIKLTAPEQVVKERPVQNLSFVIDRSGSMSGEKLDYTKKAVTFAVGHLSPQDYCSVVAFDDMVTMVAPSHKVENKDDLKMAVESIYPGGSTNLSGGMLLGLREVKLAHKENQINRVLLLTDGMANVGVTDHGALVEKAREMAAGGVNLSIFGLGDDFEEDLLQAMAEAGGGNFYYIETPDQIPGIFDQELTGLLNIVAQNLSVKVKPGQDVAITGVFGYPFTTGEGVTVNLPDIYSGETKILLLELVILPLAEGTHKLLSVELDYADVRENLALVNLKADLSVNASAEPGDGPAENVEVIKQVELFRCAQAKEEAIRLADQEDFEASRFVLEKQLLKMQSLGASLSCSEINMEVNELQENLSYMSEGSYDKVLRKKMSFNVYQRKKGRGNNKAFTG